MALRIAGLPVPGPAEILGTARTVVDWSAAAVSTAAGLPSRVDGLLGEAERLVGQLRSMAEQADDLLARAGRVVTGAERMLTVAGAVAADAAQLVTRADGVATSAGKVVTGAEEITSAAVAVVGEAGNTARAASELLDSYQPIAAKAAPLARRFVDGLSEAEVTAAIHLVDQLPAVTGHLQRDIMPILATLDRVGPDVSELLDVTKEVRHAITGIPGFAFFSRRGAERAEEDPDRPGP